MMNKPNSEAKRAWLKNGNTPNQLTNEQRSKGGKSTSAKKRLASRMNGMMNSKNLSEKKRYLLALMQDQQIVQVLYELICLNLEQIDDPKRRDKVIEQLSKLIPDKSIHMHVEDNSAIAQRLLRELQS